ncbi:MAG: NAD(P)H-hydrate dehydratase [Clostridia bacterium]|nr:NAD(P)H-hydrate dehydratase [Clostridia bacterium]
MALKITDDTVKAIIKKRPENSHKGTFGTLQLFCGSKNMSGAPYLAASGALRCGVGLLYVSAKGKLRRVLQSRLAEPVFCKLKISPRATAFVVGCGSGKNAKHVKKVLSQSKPAVIDADAITWLSKHKKYLIKKRCETVLTPHEAEMSRLTGKDVSFISQNRELCAAEAAKEFCSVILLKGHETVIALPSGEILINTTGNSGLAKGGSGDVLAGMIGSFLAQGYSAKDAATAAVWIHGKAADILASDVSKHGILPSEIPFAAARLLARFE